MKKFCEERERKKTCNSFFPPKNQRPLGFFVFVSYVPHDDDDDDKNNNTDEDEDDERNTNVCSMDWKMKPKKDPGSLSIYREEEE
jgi:hypothetical protein